MTWFKPITTVAEVRALQQAGLLWWREEELAEPLWLRDTDEVLQEYVDEGIFSILLEE